MDPSRHLDRERPHRPGRGNQTRPFLLLPARFDLPDESIVGAATVHHLFKRWTTATKNGTAPAPWAISDGPPTTPAPAPSADVEH